MMRKSQIDNSHLQFVADTHGNSFIIVPKATNFLQCVPKVSWHEAVEDKVGGTIDENQHVNHLSSWMITLQKELLTIENG